MRVFRVKTYGRDQGRVVFFFCPFNIPQWQFALPGLPIWRLVRAGYQVVAYDYDITIATISPAVTLERMQAMLREAGGRIDVYSARGPHVFCVFGSSMGTVMAANLAAERPEVMKVILNLSYSNIAEHVIYLPSLRTVPQSIWQKYIAASGGPEGMHEQLDPFSPINLIEKLHDRQVLLFLSRADKILQYRHTQVMLKRLRAQGTKLTYYENLRLPHYLAVLRNNLNARRYLDFLARP